MQNKKGKIWTIVFIALFLGVALLTKGFGLFGSAPVEAEPAGESAVLRIPLEEVTSNAKWYEYESGKSKVKFFVVKAGDGSVKTGFDACDVCFTEKKGYRQEGDYMVCNNCGNRYPIDGLGTENKNPGGCWPGYLPSVVKDGNVIIKKSDLSNSRLGS